MQFSLAWAGVSVALIVVGVLLMIKALKDMR